MSARTGVTLGLLGLLLGLPGPARAAEGGTSPTPGPVTPARGSGTAAEELLPVPAGCFSMGQDSVGEQDERPAHRVCLSPFRLDRTEVTRGAYLECVRAGKCKAPRDLGPSFARPAQPVVGVSWDDARAYCTWRGKRLPTEAEWEFAARGPEGRTYAWGNAPPEAKYAAYGWQAQGPSDVGTHPAGATPLGHLDLTGNVWEWVADVYDPSYYPRSPEKDPTGGTCAEAVAFCRKLIAEKKQGYTGSNPIPVECERGLRGGAWNYGAEGLRASNRVHHAPRFRINVAGFRCAADAGPVGEH